MLAIIPAFISMKAYQVVQTGLKEGQSPSHRQFSWDAFKPAFPHPVFSLHNYYNIRYKWMLQRSVCPFGFPLWSAPPLKALSVPHCLYSESRNAAVTEEV